MSFANRHEVETYLAELADGGVIVEIGGGYGNGAVALAGGTAHGRKLPVYVIDPYEPYTDVLGAEYGPGTLVQFGERLRAAGIQDSVTLIQHDALTAVKDWSLPVALLWLDLSMDYADLQVVYDAWYPFVVEGGYIGITGAEYESLGTNQVANKATGCERILEEQRFVAVLQKRELSRCVFYIANSGDSGRYVREAALSAASVKQYMGLPCYLFLHGKTDEDINIFDYVYPLPDRQSSYWYLDSTRYFNRAIDELYAYQQIMYLDTDTHICCPCDVWALLARCDLALGHSPQREHIESVVGCPPPFSTLQIGVNLFNLTDKTRLLFADWLERYEQHVEIYGDNDQAALRDALWENVYGVRWLVLPPEYCARFDFGGWYVGSVRILHGRVGGVSTDRMPLDDVCREINSTRKMRVWNHGLIKE